MNIVELYIENLMCRKAVPITPDGRVVELTGMNGSGKSSVLNAIFYALAGTKNVGSRPVRKGAERAIIRLKIKGEARELTITRRFTAAGGTSLTVESAEGAVFKSPQALLDTLIEGLSFDPLAFANMSAKAQYETLRALVPLDIDVDALDKLNAADYEARTGWNKEIITRKERAKVLAADVNVELANRPLHYVSTLTQRLADAAERNAGIVREKERRDSLLEHAASLDIEATAKSELAQTLRQQADALDAEADKMTARKDEIQSTVLSLPPLDQSEDVTALRDEIDVALRENASIEAAQRKADDLASAFRDVDGATVMSKSLTDAIDARTKQTQAAIARAKMPIDGLSFGDGELLYNDNPYSQASQGQAMRVATSIGIALNPALKIIFVRNAVLLDPDGRQVVIDLCEEKGCQAWFETVSPTPTKGFHVVDGRIAAVDGVAVPEPELEPEPAGVGAED